MRTFALAISLLTFPIHGAAPSGILLLAHGGSASWNDNVHAVAASVDRTMPTEVAFGMASRPAIQAAIDRLERRGVSRIVAVPLFISSHSSIVTSTQYLLRLRKELPADLTIFARMGADHSQHTGAGTAPAPAEDGTLPVKLSVPVAMTSALDAHPLVSAMIAARASAISTDSGKESLVLIAHGPNDDDSNARWLASLRTVGDAVRLAGGYQSVDALTLRDDAPPAIRSVAVAALRDVVRRRSEAARVLVVPVVLSFGGIEGRLRKDLDGLPFTMSRQGLAPDPAIASWVLEMAFLGR